MIASLTGTVLKVGLDTLVMGVGGVGVVGGVVYALTAPALPSGCDGARQTCTQFDGEAKDSFDSRRDQAGKHDTQAKTGIIIAAGGGVVLAAPGKVASDSR